MKYLIVFVWALYTGCECCRPDIKLGEKYLESETLSYMPAQYDTVWVYTNQYSDTIKLSFLHATDTVCYIGVDVLCDKGLDRQEKYWLAERDAYYLSLDTFAYHAAIEGRTERLIADTMLYDFLSVYLNGLILNKITSLRNMDTSSLRIEDRIFLENMNSARDSASMLLSGKWFYNILYIVVTDTAYLQDSLSCSELYYAKGVGIVGFKLKNGKFWVLENINYRLKSAKPVASWIDNRRKSLHETGFRSVGTLLNCLFV